MNRKSLSKLHPSAFLLAVQVFSLFLYASFEGQPIGRSIINIVGLIVLVLAVWVVNRSPAANWIAWTLASLAFLFSILSTITSNSTLFVVSCIIESILYFYTASSLMAYMLEDTHVTIDEMFAAGATFTLLAWGFAYLYLACQTVFVGSFSHTASLNHSLTFLELLFLSFANLSATGLSDILPITSYARVLVMLEQFAGVAYVAVVVSRLVGLTVLRHEHKQN